MFQGNWDNFYIGILHNRDNFEIETCKTINLDCSNLDCSLHKQECLRNIIRELCVIRISGHSLNEDRWITKGRKMQNEKIYLERIKRFINEIYEKRYFNHTPLEAEYIVDKINPIPYQKVIKRKFKPIKIDEKWGEDWSCGWFKFKGDIPSKFKGLEVAALIDIQGEACVFKDGVPYVGLTNKIHWNLFSGKNFVPLYNNAEGREKVELLLEAGANGLFGKSDQDYKLKQAELVCVNRKIYDLDIDLRVLNSLLESLEEKSPHRKKIISGINEVVNIWQDGKGIDKCLLITKKLLSQPANASSLTVYSIGHAHLDCAWLWPLRETRRKAGRTFSTALKFMEEFPDYKFGASQPQLYQFVKEDYSELYQKIKQAVKDKKWECQGAMWVEPDMNLTSGESLVRQCFYGKKFYRDEFSVEVDNCWLPDVFGYSAALPQILKKCGVDFFMTQKISWNATNTFPHHTFYWEGIDGTRILTHFLPTNDYNLSNFPHQLIESEKRFAQSDVSDEFLNLYGIGDGGGGPSRFQIEMGIRQQNLEGTPKFKFSFAQDFFDKISQIPPEKLPVWVGELYLELHRGTYTTRALMKKFNRQLETKLHDVEFLSTLVENYPKAEIEQIWKDTLLNQFHDILPGSSIGWVYEDACRTSELNLRKLEKIQNEIISKLYGKTDKIDDNFIVYNTLCWDRKEIIQIPAPKGNYWVEGEYGAGTINTSDGNFIEYEVWIPAMGYTAIRLEPTNIPFPAGEPLLKATATFLENGLIKVEIADDGSISSIFDKEENREVLSGFANKLLLWEDKPINWESWDINHFYRETIPEQAKRASVQVEKLTDLQAVILQKFKIGNSKIEQKVSIRNNSKLVKIENKVDWKEAQKMLRASAKVNIFTNEATSEIQFGTIKRPTHSNTTWDDAKFEIPAQRFVDLSQSDYGIALINDCKYGHFIKDNFLDLNLLRSPKDLDEKSDIHKHEFTFCYYPHKGNLIASDTLEIAHKLNDPVIFHPIKNLPEKRSFGFYQIQGQNVKLETIKRAENGKGTILRLYEYAGSNSKIILNILKDWKSVIETDLLENNLQSIEGGFNSIELEFNPFEIKTYRIEF